MDLLQELRAIPGVVRAQVRAGVGDKLCISLLTERGNFDHVASMPVDEALVLRHLGQCVAEVLVM
jgi:hypothetical protein